MSYLLKPGFTLRSERQSCRASVHHDSVAHPRALMRNGHTTKDQHKVRTKGWKEKSLGQRLAAPLTPCLGSSRRYQFYSKQILGWRALVAQSYRVPPQGHPKVLWWQTPLVQMCLESTLGPALGTAGRKNDTAHTPGGYIPDRKTDSKPKWCKGAKRGAAKYPGLPREVT